MRVRSRRARNPRRRSLFLPSVVGWLLALPAAAQLETDSVPFLRTIAPQEQIAAEVENARFHLGPVRILPKIILRNAGYDDNVTSVPEGQGEKIGDWTATLGLGARLILPAGSKVYLVGEAIPEYTWYLDLTERREWGGRYAGGVYGFFNRMTVEVYGNYTDGIAQATPETPTQVRETGQGGVARIEIEFVRNLSVWAAGELQSREYDPLDDLPTDIEDPAELNR
ncbi:MAG TPA: hypothetical protein VIB08_00735, partial [Thermoanaerobaculia bacterium]